KIEYITFVLLRHLDAGGVDAVRDVDDLVLTEAADNGVSHESAGRDKPIYPLIAACRRVIPSLGPKQRAPSDRTTGAALQEQRFESAIGALRAQFAFPELRINRTHRLVVVKGENDRSLQPRSRIDDRGRQLVINVVAVQYVWFFMKN